MEMGANIYPSYYNIYHVLLDPDVLARKVFDFAQQLISKHTLQTGV